MVLTTVLLAALIAAAEAHVQHLEGGGGGGRGPHHPRGQVASHTHYRPHRQQEHPQPKLTQDTELLRDTEHISEDLGDIASLEDISKMTPDELEFHYFKLHDFDNNTKLDGLEILQAIHHTLHKTGEKTDADDSSIKPRDDDDFNYFVEFIDRVLAEDDLDRDGYLSYIEYVVGQQRDKKAHQGKPKQPK